MHPKPEYKQPKTNIELVTEFMENGSHMNQLFVMSALIKYAEQIVANEAKLLKAMENSFIHGPSWVQSAKDFIALNKNRQ